MKINKIINIGLCVSLLSGLFIQPANAITKDYIYNDDYDKGVKIGSVIYDYDENGNIIERIVDDEGTITVAELYGRNIGQGDAIEAINEDAETASENDLTPIKEVEYYLINLKPDGTQEKVSTFTLYEEAIKAYEDKFGGFPYFLMMGVPDEVVVAAVEKSLKTGEKIKPEEEDVIY